MVSEIIDELELDIKISKDFEEWDDHILITDEQFNAISAISPFLTPDILKKIKETIFHLPTENVLGDNPKIQAIIAIASYDAAILSDFAVIESALSIKTPEYRARALARLLRHLSATKQSIILQYALNCVWEINERNFSERARVLANLAPYLSISFIQNAIEYIQEVDYTKDRIQILTTVSRSLAGYPPVSIYPIWRKALRRLARRNRTELIADLAALAPVLVALGGEQAVASTVRAILDIGKRWP